MQTRSRIALILLATSVGAPLLCLLLFGRHGTMLDGAAPILSGFVALPTTNAAQKPFHRYAWVNDKTLLLVRTESSGVLSLVLHNLETGKQVVLAQEPSTLSATDTPIAISPRRSHAVYQVRTTVSTSETQPPTAPATVLDLSASDSKSTLLRRLPNVRLDSGAWISEHEWAILDSLPSQERWKITDMRTGRTRLFNVAFPSNICSIVGSTDDNAMIAYTISIPAATSRPAAPGVMSPYTYEVLRLSPDGKRCEVVPSDSKTFTPMAVSPDGTMLFGNDTRDLARPSARWRTDPYGLFKKVHLPAAWLKDKRIIKFCLLKNGKTRVLATVPAVNPDETTVASQFAFTPDSKQLSFVQNGTLYVRPID